jgi:hypothetical protein
MFLSIKNPLACLKREPASETGIEIGLLTEMETGGGGVAEGGGTGRVAAVSAGSVVGAD